MRVVTERNLNQAEKDIRKRKDERNAQVRIWRQNQKMEKRVSVIVQEYVKEKYQNIYTEAVNFYATLSGLYPKKNDLRKTKEFREWKKAKPGNNRETSTTATTANQTNANSTTTSNQAAQDQTNANSRIDQAVQQTNNFTLRIPLIPQPSIPQAEISPQELEIGAEYTVETPPLQAEMQGITDQRIQEIIEELRNDPDLNGIFNDIDMPTEQDDPDLNGIFNDIDMPTEQDDEGIEDDIFW